MAELAATGHDANEIAEALGTGRKRSAVYHWIAANADYLGQAPVLRDTFIKADERFCEAMEKAIAGGMRDPRVRA